MINNLIGPVYDAAWLLLVLVCAVTLFLAIRRWSQRRTGGLSALLELLLIVLIPLIGPCAYLMGTRRPQSNSTGTR